METDKSLTYEDVERALEIMNQNAIKNVRMRREVWTYWMDWLEKAKERRDGN